VRDPEQIDAAAAPLVGNARADAKPVRRPERTEVLAEPGRPVLQLLRFLPRDPVDRTGDEQLVRRTRLCIDERE
jgi:hypothetical protein